MAVLPGCKSGDFIEVPEVAVRPTVVAARRSHKRWFGKLMRRSVVLRSAKVTVHHSDRGRAMPRAQTPLYNSLRDHWGVRGKPSTQDTSRG